MPSMELICHCENVRIRIAKPDTITQCNCSICRRYGSLWAYYTPDAVQIRIGEFGTDRYTWGDRSLDFMRCGHCGCITHYASRPGQAEPRIGVNVAMDKDAVADVPVRKFDGARLL